MNESELTKLSHDLWKQKIIYERASELAEKASFDEKYIFLLNEVLEEIKEINQKWFEEKSKEHLENGLKVPKDINEVVIKKKGRLITNIIINGNEMRAVKSCLVTANMTPLKSNQEIQITLGNIRSLTIERVDD